MWTRSYSTTTIGSPSWTTSTLALISSAMSAVPSSVSLRARIDPTTWQTGRTFRYSGLCRTMTFEENSMSKRARKRRDRKKTGPNHGKRPNA